MHCRICSNDKNNTEHIATENMFGSRDKFLYFQCSLCGCLQISDYPVNIIQYYGSNYYSYDYSISLKSKILSKFIKIRDRYAVDRVGLFGSILYRLEPNPTLSNTFLNLPDKFKDRNISILDVGCGAALFLRKLSNIGFKHLMGVDPFIAKDEMLKPGFSIFKKSIFDLSETFDLIFLHHSLEHMEHQQKVMAALARLLKPGGICVIRIPVASSFAWSEYGTDWVQLDAPRHYYLHSLKSMEYVVKSAGLTVAAIHFDSTNFQFWGSELYKMNVPLKVNHVATNPKIFFSRQVLNTFSKRARELNHQKLGDQAIFYLKNQD